MSTAIPARTASVKDLSGDKTLKLGNQLCFSVYATAHAFNAAYKPLLEPLGLTYPQYLAMLVLWDQDDLSVSAIGEQLGLDSGTLTPLLKRLEALGLVERQRNPADERQLRVSLTEGGRALKAKARAVPPQVLAASGLTLDQLLRLKREIDVLAANLRSAPDEAEAK
jgi:DNA-binding MarR family transcriptional regulator